MIIDRRPDVLSYRAFVGLITTPTAAGFAPLPGSLQDGPGPYGQLAAILICVGCLIFGGGLAIPVIRRKRRTLKQQGVWRLIGMVAEMVGLGLCTLGCGLYDFALIGVDIPKAAVLPGAIIGGLGIGSVVQLIFHYRHLRRHVTTSGDSEEDASP